jgi:hypothetical protein
MVTSVTVLRISWNTQDSCAVRLTCPYTRSLSSVQLRVYTTRAAVKLGRSFQSIIRLSTWLVCCVCLMLLRKWARRPWSVREREREREREGRRIFRPKERSGWNVAPTVLKLQDVRWSAMRYFAGSLPLVWRGPQHRHGLSPQRNSIFLNPTSTPPKKWISMEIDPAIFQFVA